jgi:glutathione S-transferase
MNLPILYSYRRCPYAMRARMALQYAEIAVDIYEITLSAKPVAMLTASAKGTVPVLVLRDALTEQTTVLEQSLDIMHWALQRQDKSDWLGADAILTQQLIAENDTSFKLALDKYKYSVRFPEQSAEANRGQAMVFLDKLEQLLSASPYLLSTELTLADIAIFPFIRQFVAVDAIWFAVAPYPKLRSWLSRLVESSLFISVMVKPTI